jgi:hypothetical protein
MLLLLLAAALSGATPQQASPLATASTCPRTAGYYAWQRGKQVAPRKLTELPPANAYYTVYRRIDGCMVPVIVKYGVGGR